MYNYYNYPNYLQNSNFEGKNSRNVNYQNDNLFNPYQGLIRGNLFKNIYQPYKNEKPYEIKPMNEQAKMLTELDSLEFALVDLNLYLDVYPDDREAIQLFNQYRIERQDLLNQYQNKYGPILISSEALNQAPWMWDNRPWPWEN